MKKIIFYLNPIIIIRTFREVNGGTKWVKKV
jgi:hypothetical protein